MDNIQFSYLYRDGSNYKRRGQVVFSNPDRLPNDFIEEELRQAFLPDRLFIAGQIRLPNVFLYMDGPFSFNDHCYHEFDLTSPTSETPNDMHRRSITEFVAEARREASRGWQVFDPYDSNSATRWSQTPRAS